MPLIKYENEEAVIKFEYADVITQLKLKVAEYNVDDDAKLLQWLDKQSKRKEIIEIGDNQELTSRFCYLICNLIDNRKGKVFCKACSRAYQPDQILKESTSPFDRRISSKNIKELKKFHKKEFGSKGPVHFPGIGGKIYKCPKGHILISVRTWIT